MPPIRKVDLDKAAWSWCNDVDSDKISDENIETAYRLYAPKCQYSTCRRNCLGNPFCVNGLGESKWLSDAVEELNDEDLDQEYRRSDSFVGLRNLGATCYINSLLQLWFHNIAFRNAILRWNPEEDARDNVVISNLQFLFTLMQFGRKKSVDPSDFVTSLEIDVSLQQDAREFSQLFTAYLEDHLKRQSDPSVSNLVNNNFQGHYNYVTRCTNCHTESVRESTFYELEVNIKGHKTLDESLVEFLQEEKLEGPNKYLCGVCQSKQDATRHIELSHLPPVFNIQLIRFLYDREKGMKKKLNTPLQFPEKLDMSPYLNKRDPDNDKENRTRDPVTYNLFAVLIHKGPSANSGHYVAHICDQITGNWYMFNDENTQKIEGKKLKLNSDEDYEVDETGKKQKTSKAIKGYLCSSNAYMLVYTLCNSNIDKQPIGQQDLKQHLKQKLEEYNTTFDSIIYQSREEKRSQIEDENIMKAEMASVLPTLPVTENNDWEAISVKWLSNWISSNKSEGFYSVDNKYFTCSHNKIDPHLIKEFKFINKTAASSIYEKYGGGPRLDKNSLCKDCVRSMCELIKFKNKISVDQKEITTLCKVKNLDSDSYWIGKDSLRTWRTKAFKIFDQFRNEDNRENNLEDDDSPSPSCSPAARVLSPSERPVSPLSNRQNGHHQNGSKNGELSPSSHDNGIDKNGTDNSSVATDNDSGINEEPPCKKVKSCEGTNEGGSDDGKFNNGHKSDDDQEDGEYDYNFNEDIVCTHGNLCVNENSRRLIPELAWSILKCYFPDCIEFRKDTEPCLECLSQASLYEVAKNVHKQQASKEKELLTNLYLNKNRPKQPLLGKYYVLSNHEFVEPWRKFIREPTRHDPLTSLRNNHLICSHNQLIYNAANPQDLESLALVTDHEWQKIQTNFKVDKEISLEFKEDGEIISTPEVCKECVAARIAAEQQALLQYTDANIYIRQICKLDQEESSVPTSTNTNNEQKPKGDVVSIEGPIRRSSRNKRRKDEKNFKISSHQTLIMLKIEIYNWLGVAPYDQHLILENGEELLDHQATLSSLNVYPDSVIYLKVDEPVDESSLDESVRKKPKFEPEHGFKGTGLLKR